MNKARNGFIKYLRYLCLIGVIALGLIMIVGSTGGGGGDGDGGETPSDTYPTATITSPSDGSTYNQGDTISFSGTGEDAEDGALTGSSLVWTSSIDGQIGTGGSFQRSNLSAGTHTITLTATDSEGATGSDSVSIESVEEAQGEPYVDVYDPEKACDGTTLFTDAHDSQSLRVLEVNMQGDIVWEYVLPQDWIQGGAVGFDAELLDNGNILITLSDSGIYEIDRSGNTVWSYQDPKVSHDADRLPNGNTIYVFGNDDEKTDAQIKEVDSAGNLVWSWYAKDHYNVPPYDTIERQGWTHTNAVTRLDNGNTLISLRNFNLTIEVASKGDVAWSFDWGTLYESDAPLGFDPHEPEIETNDHLLVCLQWDTPYQVVEIDRATGQPVWEYHREGLRTCRDADRLANGNTLIVAVLTGGTRDDLSDDESVIFEVTPSGEIVWQLKLKDTPAGQSPGWFYKAQRTCKGS